MRNADESLRRLERQAAAGGDVMGQRLAIGGSRIVEDHFGTIAACGCHLDGGRVQRHHDRSRNSQQLRRERYALRVIA